MDRVRFGRALGFGARQAAKTLVKAVDAATAESPSARRAGAAGGGGRSDADRADAKASDPVRNAGQASMPAPEHAKRDTVVKQAAHTAATAVIQTREVKQGLKRGGRRFGEAVWGRFARLSGVLWLEVSGVFFGLFALAALGYLLKYHAAWRATAEDAGGRRSLMGAVAMLVLFGYFCVSNFVRARRRERGR